MARRSQGEGSIFRRSDGRWCAALQAAGKRTCVYGRTRQEAAQKLAALTAVARTSGRLPNAGVLTLGDYLTDWLSRSQGRLRPGTLASYTTLARVHIMPRLGHVRLSRVHPLHLARLYSDVLCAGLSPRRGQMVHRVLHKALSDAVRLGLLGQPTRPIRSMLHGLSNAPRRCGRPRRCRPS